MPKPTSAPDQEADLYDLYDELDRLEELLEDLADAGEAITTELRDEMTALGVMSAEDGERRIVEINDRIDEMEGAEG